MNNERINGAVEEVSNRYRKATDGMEGVEKGEVALALVRQLTTDANLVVEQKKPATQVITPEPVRMGGAMAAAAMGATPIAGGGGITAAEAVARAAGGEPLGSIAKDLGGNGALQDVVDNAPGIPDGDGVLLAVGTTAKYGCPLCGADHLDVPVYVDGGGAFFPCCYSSNERVEVNEDDVVWAPDCAAQAGGGGDGPDTPAEGQEGNTDGGAASTGDSSASE